MNTAEEEIVVALSAKADFIDPEPYFFFANSEMQDRYYELRAKALGYNSFSELENELNGMWLEFEDSLPSWVKEEEAKLAKIQADAIKLFFGDLLA